MKNTIRIICILFSIAVTAQVPKYGNDTLLDVACWNLKWLGNTSNGPTDEVLQYNNVQKVLNQSDIDVWGLCEMSDLTTWTNLLSSMPQYNGVISTFSQDQKTALVWKKNKFNLLSQQAVLADAAYSSDFAGRPPLEVVLITKNVPVIDTLYFYVIHLKAFADSESYDRRKNASQHLKTFLDTYRANRKVMVVGDWNDDLDMPTWSGASMSPFANFLQQGQYYFFPTKLLSDLGKKSYVFAAGSMIDHILINAPLFPFDVNASAKVLDDLPAYIPGYSSNTSDHYPVMAFLNLKRYVPVGSGENGLNFDDVYIFPNPASDYVIIQTHKQLQTIHILDMQGRSVHMSCFTSTQTEYIIPIHHLKLKGMYHLLIFDTFGNPLRQKVIFE